jgi:RNA polymerase sigma-70 factor, ECF subfamily
MKLAILPIKQAQSRPTIVTPTEPTVTPTVATEQLEEEHSWVVRAREGDVAAFEWLMDRYRDRAIRLASHVLRRPNEAEDLVQEAFLRVFCQLPEFRGDASFYTWLYKIVVRLCLNRMRSPGWRYSEPGLDVDFVPVPSTASESERSETRLLVEVLLDRLSPPLRAALVLRELEGLEYEEIALALGVPVGTVRSRLNAARAQFRAQWLRAMEEVRNV